MTKALVTNEPQQLDHPIEGLEGFGPEDMVIPRLKLIQPTSREAADGDATPGTVVCNLSGAAYDAIKLVPLFLRKGRVLFREGDERPTCASDDNIVPSPRIENPIQKKCAGCPRQEWVDGVPPDCALVYSIFALNLTAGEAPFILQCKGTAIKPTKKLISYFTLQKLSPFSVSCTLKPAKTKNSRGTFFVPDFVGMEVIEPRDKYRDQFLALRGYDVQKTYDAEEGAADEAPPAGREEPGADVPEDDLPF